MNKIILAAVSGLTLGSALTYLLYKKKGRSVDATVYQAYLDGQNKQFGGNVFCAKHPGNGVLMWNDGNLRCYECGRLELHGNTEHLMPIVTKRPDAFEDILRVTF